MTILIGGPFDGAPALCGDPVAPSIWPAWICATIFYRPYAVPGRPRYNRVAEGRYVFDSLILGAEVPERVQAA